MKCKNCTEEISTKFHHAISTNICPFCGQEIISLELQTALSELQEIMKLTDQYKTEIFEWLKTNYNLIDANSEEYKALEEKAKSTPVKIKVDPKEVKLDDKGNQLTGTPLNTETTNVFAKRAGVKMGNQDHFKSIVSQIKNSGGSGETNMILGAGGLGSEASPEDIAAYQEILGGGSSAIPSVGAIGGEESFGNDDGEPIPAIVEAFARQKGGAVDYNARDVAKLENLQYKSQQAKREMREGGSIGLIRRS